MYCVNAAETHETFRLEDALGTNAGTAAKISSARIAPPAHIATHISRKWRAKVHVCLPAVAVM
jgi:hypothetical protein